MQKKCCDKLWIKDCLIEASKLDMTEKDADMLYWINKKAFITVNTLLGDPEECETHEIVKQGTTSGPLLCCVETCTMNKIGEQVEEE